jgi:hypothetical protein
LRSSSQCVLPAKHCTEKSSTENVVNEKFTAVLKELLAEPG